MESRVKSKLLFDNLPEVHGKIKEADLLVLFLDYDGTLVPLKDRPEEAVVSEDLRKVLNVLVQDPRCMVAILSGRTVEDLDKMLNLDGLSLIGLNGLEISFSDGSEFIWEKARETEDTIRKIKRRLNQELGKEEGLYIEDKGLTLSLPRGWVREVTEKFIETTKNYTEKTRLEIMPGPEVLEVRPQGWNKGKALEEFFKRLTPNKDILPIYMGDDQTDEDAFRYLKGRGISVRVIKDPHEPTRAAFHLQDNLEVLRFLIWIVNTVRGKKEKWRCLFQGHDWVVIGCRQEWMDYYAIEYRCLRCGKERTWVTKEKEANQTLKSTTEG